MHTSGQRLDDQGPKTTVIFYLFWSNGQITAALYRCSRRSSGTVKWWGRVIGRSNKYTEVDGLWRKQCKYTEDMEEQYLLIVYWINEVRFVHQCVILLASFLYTQRIAGRRLGAEDYGNCFFILEQWIDYGCSLSLQQEKQVHRG